MNTYDSKEELNPYKFKSALVKEQYEDDALDYVKALCINYIRKDVEDFKAMYEASYIFDSYKYVNMQLEKLNKTKTSMKLMDSTPLFVGIGHSLDLITLSYDTDLEFNLKSLYYELALQLNSALEMLEFCQIILEKIIYTRRKRNDN